MGVQERRLKDVYRKLGCTRDDFWEMVANEIENGITREYSARIADVIADDVAEDVIGSADPKEWNTCDVSLGAGRVLIKALGVDV